MTHFRLILLPSLLPSICAGLLAPGFAHAGLNRAILPTDLQGLLGSYALISDPRECGISDGVFDEGFSVEKDPVFGTVFSRGGRPFVELAMNPTASPNWSAWDYAMPSGVFHSRTRHIGYVDQVGHVTVASQSQALCLGLVPCGPIQTIRASLRRLEGTLHLYFSDGQSVGNCLLRAQRESQ